MIMQNQYKVQITKYALEQMEKIRDYISYELYAPQAAHDLILEMKNKVASLSSMPERNPLVDSKKWRERGIRKMIVKNFIMYYWIDEKLRTVHITAVVYEKREQLRELGKMEMDAAHLNRK